jgi:hypothetical protein
MTRLVGIEYCVVHAGVAGEMSLAEGGREPQPVALSELVQGKAKQPLIGKDEYTVK